MVRFRHCCRSEHVAHASSQNSGQRLSEIEASIIIFCKCACTFRISLLVLRIVRWLSIAVCIFSDDTHDACEIILLQIDIHMKRIDFGRWACPDDLNTSVVRARLKDVIMLLTWHNPLKSHVPINIHNKKHHLLSHFRTSFSGIHLNDFQ